MEQERRFGRRESVELRARIATENGRTVEVIVRDLSFSGCRIEKPDYAQIPDNFTLTYVEIDKPEIEAVVVWRRSNEVGARFLKIEGAEDTPKRAAVAEVQKLSISDLRKIAGRAG